VDDKKAILIECDNLVKIYKTKEIEVLALQGLDLIIHEGEFTAIIGKSGSGKSTLLNIIAGLDRPSAGSVTIHNQDLLKFTDAQLQAYNQGTIGFVWQNNARNLIPYLTAMQNVMVPLMITRKKEKKERAKYLLDLVGMGHKMQSKLAQLSGGEQQRVAIAIALANNPKLLLADEPTGSLDTKTAYHILNMLKNLNEELKITILLVTHDPKVANMVDRVIAINDGMIGSELHKKKTHEDSIDQESRDVTMMDTKKSHEEFVIIDRKGRMKVPEGIFDSLNLKGGEHMIVDKKEDGFTVSKRYE
jgi:ABC-type lipoprotein export system ATPase subunit